MPHKLSFRVIYATSQDDYHKASEISNHSPGSKGWHSSNFCLYPQDIVILLEHRCQIKKIQLLSHQYLIATKVEFFVGDCANNVQLSYHNAKFSRLGYVSLSDNEKTQFKARELKSVHVDAIGRFVKLVIHTNFINKHNHYNQVGIIAVNVLGDEIFSHSNDEVENVVVSSKNEYTSPTEDLAFDMSVDPETAQIIRNLEKLKLQAVQDEEFDKAKKILDTITYFQEVGEKLGKLEIEKRNAIDNENYDRAKLKKDQIDQYRYRVYKELNSQEFLHSMTNNNQGVYKPAIERDQYSHRELNQNNNAVAVEETKPYQNPEDRPLPALKNQPLEIVSPKRSEPNEIDLHSAEPVSVIENDDEMASEMSKSDLSEASDAIEVYGLPLVAKVYGKNWAHREEALVEVERRLQGISRDADKEDIKLEIRAVTCLLKKAFKSRITHLTQIAMNINKLILTELIDKIEIPKPDVHHFLDKIVPEIFKCIEDNKAQIREMTMPYLLEMSQWDHVKQFPTIFNDAIKPLNLNILVRPGQIRCELLMELYHIHRLNNHYFTLDNFMKYAIQTLQHKSTELRESAETLIVVLYRNEDKQIIRSYLPPDDMKTRKNVLYKRLFEKLDKIDGLNPESNAQKVVERYPNRQKEADNSQFEEQKPKDQMKSKPVVQAAKKAPTKTNPSKESQNVKTIQPKSNEAPVNQQSHPPKLDIQENFAPDWNITCIFCGEKGEWLKDKMDIHYWKNCPILRRCPYCKQAVEISSLTQHFLQECEQKSQFGQCPRCTEAVLKVELDQHISDVLCNPADLNNSIRCPLCHDNIPFNDRFDSIELLWQFHLMDESKGCPQNPRRLVGIQRQHQLNVNNPSATYKPNMNINRKSQLPRAKEK